ncbi:MAG: hypothetical protein Q8Q89_02690 [bacterium]|nr:hypothetical protein [bacterium]
MRSLIAGVFSIIILVGSVGDNYQLEAQNDKMNLKRAQEFEFTSVPGAPDLIEMLSEYDDPRNDWDTARRHMRTIKLYHGQVTKQTNPDILRIVQGNTLERLVSTGSIRNINLNFKMKLALEVGAMKSHNCLYSEYDVQRAVNSVVDSVGEIYKAGGVVHRLDIDTSLADHCRATLNDVGFFVGRFIMRAQDSIKLKQAELKLEYPDSEFAPVHWAEIEPYPFRSISQHITYVRKLQRDLINLGYEPLEVYFLDIDPIIVSDAVLTRDFQVFREVCRSLGVKVGIIINGDDEDPKNPWLNKDLDYLRTANDRLARFKELGIIDGADVIMVQSWATEANNNRTVPRNVPETGITHTNFFVHVVKCATGVVDCETYPELE